MAFEVSLDLRTHAIDRLGVEVRVVQGSTPQEFGNEAAPFLAEYLQQARTCGCSWGSDVASVIEGLEQAPIGRTGRVECFPLRGHPLGSAVPAVSPSRLAERLHRIFSDQDTLPISLDGVPAMLPPLEHKVIMTIDRSLRQFGGYRRVVETLLPHADMILSSVGALSDLSPWTKQCLQATGQEVWPLQEWLEGDLSGIALHKTPLLPEQQAKIARLDQHWLGVNRQHLKRCVAEGRVGVVVIARHPKKAQAVLQACRLGLVSRLIISSELAKVLVRHLGAPR